MTITGALSICATVGCTAWAIYSDRRKWRTKPREELVGLVQSEEWRRWGQALKELQRRGEDITVHIPRLLSALLSDARFTREAARITLVDTFPELRAALNGYRSVDDMARNRERLGPLLSRYGVQAP